MKMKTIALTSHQKGSRLADDVCCFLESLGLAVVKPEYQDQCGAFAAQAAALVSAGSVDGAIAIGSTGLEGSILGNKYAHVRAALVSTPTTAMYTREHNDSNLLCLGEDITGRQKLLDIVERWVKSDFIGGRHAISLGMIEEGELHQFAQGSDAVLLKTRRPIKHIYIGNDHAGYEAKLQILKILEARGISYTDLGTDSTDIVRYPYYAARVDQAVLAGKADAGIAICGTGIGISIAANKFKGIRAALCNDKTTARYARDSFDANVLCLGGKIVGPFEVEEIVNEWLAEPCGEPSPFLDLLSAIEGEKMTATDWRPANNV